MEDFEKWLDEMTRYEVYHHRHEKEFGTRKGSREHLIRAGVFKAVLDKYRELKSIETEKQD